MTPTETVIWVIHHDSIDVVRLPLSRAKLIDAVREFRRAIAERAELDAVLRQARTLHASVFSEVAQKLRARRVIIVPHDVLHYLPFPALRTPESRWLVEYTLSTVPSASVLRYLRGNEDDPLSWALVLAGDVTGRLDVREIFRLDLNAKLVVLSACRTGLGKLSKGDELIGLQRAFLYAGARSVVTTLWEIDDRSTLDVMRLFYDALKTRGPADALRDAQRTAATRYSHPFAWAAFGLAG